MGYLQAVVKISKRKSVVTRVDRTLRELASANGWRLGDRQLDYQTFTQSPGYLVKVR